MAQIFAWLFAFFLNLALLLIIGFQITCLVDLEFDYINPYDAANRINKAIIPEFVIQGILCLFLLLTGNWIMLLASLPCLYYNLRLYMQRQYVVDVTEIYNHLKREKRKRFIKGLYFVVLFILSLLELFWNLVEIQD